MPVAMAETGPGPGTGGPPAGLPGVTALVVAYRKPSSLERALSQLGPGTSACVVNVDADPAVSSVARRHGAGVLELAGNPGFGPAVNAGLAMVETGVVVVLNDDVVITSESMAGLAAAVAAGADVAGPRLVTPEGRPEPSVIDLPGPLRVLLWALLPDTAPRLLRRLPVAKWRRPEAPGPVPALTAAVLAVRTSLLRRCPMPEDYFLYWEETEWFWRLHRIGARVELRPEVVAVHDGGRADVRPEKAALLARNAVRCVRRTNGRAAAAVAWPAVVLGAARLLATDLVRAAAGRVGGDRLRARWAGLVAALSAVGELA